MIIAPPSTGIFEAATYIWEQQDILNARCHPEGRGTIDRVGNRTVEEERALEFDYYLALHGEIDELISNFIWKHWAKETRQGRRFELVNPSGAAGEGTAQNVAVELIDIVFFTVSILHLRRKAAAWRMVWGSDATWEESARWVDSQVSEAKGMRGLERLSSKENNAFMLKTLKAFEVALYSGSDESALCSLLHIFSAAGLSWNSALNLYFQKLKVNHERQDRGRSQVGDAHSHAENAQIK